jgi:hypothetical protein
MRESPFGGGRSTDISEAYKKHADAQVRFLMICSVHNRKGNARRAPTLWPVSRPQGGI